MAPATVAAPATVGSPTDTAWNISGARARRGAATVGTTAYAVPTGAIFASPTAAAGGNGRAATPYKTAQAAINAAPSGATIVLRGGTYHENITVPAGKKLTIQAYPKEAVWFDGTEAQTGWTASGSKWYVGGWNHVFDSSPTFTRGAPDGTSAGWQWINPAYPMAAHPEELFIDGAPQRQVASLSQVVPGTFFADTTAHRLYIGSNPSGHQVRAATLTKAMSLRGAGTTVRGIGIRGYATSVWMMGAVTVEAPGTRLENVSISDTATTGLFVGASSATLQSVTVARNGLMGIGANYADGLTLNNVLSVQNNSEHFNRAPVSGGLKVTKTRGLTIRNSAFLRNDGPGLWTDQSVYAISVAGTDFVGNAGHGAFFEISQKVDFVNNLLLGNLDSALKINDTGSVRVWNNTIVGGDRTLEIVQDGRKANDPSVPGHDMRQPFPDPTMPWLIRNISVANNVIAGTTGNCALCVEDYTHTYSASSLNITPNGNMYQRTSGSSPTWLVVWSRGAGNPAVYTLRSSFTKATGQDPRSKEFFGNPITASNGQLLSAYTSWRSSTAITPPSAFTSLLGTATPQLGAIFN
ncbi:MAG TPA: right-handed parallel beta-helix repeat-containing protein [Microbacterium sp.]|uniref:right-handed parallel beta-helix repeat-containing protein n=1 Tax=Microbacterium sp. TaxID=51671 RepID=UPI002B49BF86|nr:right-handed parallel beta-helix repeat-containing protein [Microbacterium sp.]HKT57447.1 right-handed parallel beta-helix repeat-containing protein [Microbacterium sp.]